MENTIENTCDTLKIQNIVYENTYNALKSLVDNCRLNQSIIANKTFDDQYSLKEYCTVRMCAPRRSGNSSALLNVAFGCFKKAIILTPNQDMMHNLLSLSKRITNGEMSCDMNKKIVNFNGGNYYFGTINSLNNFRGLESEAVFFDVSLALSIEKESKIYTVLAPTMVNNSEKFFIFVQ